MTTTNQNISKQNINCKFEIVLKYPILLLGVGGIFPHGASIWLYAKSTPTYIPIALAKKLPVYCKNVYRVVLGIANLACVIKTTASLVAFESSTTTVEQSLVIPLCTAVWVVGTYVCRKHFPTLLAEFTDYETKFGFSHDVSKTFRLAKLVTAGIALWHFCFKFSIGVAHMFRLEETEEFVYPFDVSNEFTRVFGCIAITLLYFFVELPIYAMLLLYIVVVRILTEEFGGTKDDMARLLASPEKFEKRFAFIREKHRCLQNIVRTTSLQFRSSVILNFVFNIMIFCYVIFTVSQGEITSYGITVQIAAVAVSILGTVCITVVAGYLTMTAHSICDSINSAEWSSLPVPVLLKMNLFLTQFASKRIGLNIYGLFMLDTSTLLMVTGTVITYGVVYLQFNLRQISSCQVTNGTLVA